MTSPERREEIARIIDPFEWEQHDFGASREPAAALGSIAPSLLKADAIMALAHPRAEPLGQEVGKLVEEAQVTSNLHATYVSKGTYRDLIRRLAAALSRGTGGEIGLGSASGNVGSGQSEPVPMRGVSELNQKAQWLCPNCGNVAPEEVTFEETHDSRIGGCGAEVEWVGTPLKAETQGCGVCVYCTEIGAPELCRGYDLPATTPPNETVGEAPVAPETLHHSNPPAEASPASVGAGGEWGGTDAEYTLELVERLKSLAEDPHLHIRHTHLNGEIRRYSTITEIAANLLQRIVAPEAPGSSDSAGNVGATS